MKGYNNKKRSRQKYNWFDVQSEQRAKWESLCPVGEYRILSEQCVVRSLT